MDESAFTEGGSPPVDPRGNGRKTTLHETSIDGYRRRGSVTVDVDYPGTSAEEFRWETRAESRVVGRYVVVFVSISGARRRSLCVQA